MTDVLIQAEDMHKSFQTVKGDEVHAVNGLSLQVKAGEIYGLVGADGAGKTTAIRLLVGALKLDAGQVIIAGYPIKDKIEQARAQVGYLSQRFSLYDDLTVMENIRFFAEVRGLSRDEWLPRCQENLDFVNLSPFKDRVAGQLSGGMKQKLGLATALVSRPRILLLDEPTTGVDPVTRQDFWELITNLVNAPGKNGVCVLISTPYMDEAARCHRIGFLHDGRLIQEGTAAELRSILTGRIMELRCEPLLFASRLVAKDPGVEDVHPFGDRLHLRLKEPQPEPVIERLSLSLPKGSVSFIDARPVHPNLEDVFIYLSQQEELI
jgi:ABC-2 type transport system ATP-binding protein